ncbi:SprT-like family-domain-containing protein [Helicostylum pulchrum]|nr:SprT-like family-domain-containing protein [Helicostylum pulchrum]
MSNIDSDEAFARMLQEQDNLEYEKAYNADLELAKRMQQQSVIDLTVDEPASCSSSSCHLSTIDSDFALAQKLCNTVDESILDEETPDIHQLFLYFNKKYFDNKLDSVEVKWSSRMTRCAGTCTYKLGNHCIVALSEPLLKFRTKKEMMETLLHEMIHALLFVTQQNTDRDGHGPPFLKVAKRINDAAGFDISVYHNFHDEVNHYLTHIWQCNGVCKSRPPYFGLVKRSMNRPPQPADTWYDEHQLTCGGTYTKIASPAPKRKKAPVNTLDQYIAATKKTKQ